MEDSPVNRGISERQVKRGLPLGLGYSSGENCIDKRLCLGTWVGLVLMILQFLWIWPAAFWQMGTYVDGTVKRPLRDLFTYMVCVLPAIPAAAISFWDIWHRFRKTGTLLECKISVIVLIFALVFLAVSALGWIGDDIVNRNIPY
ncbi:MAG: hypothetical protein M3O30_16035 [Planctomycetota bacterium]|nr:hypothetical protein [Planctomycetota bacterium]